jgi:hypothetical protein
MMADHTPQSQEPQDMVEDGHENAQNVVPLDNAVAQDIHTRPANEPKWKQTVRLAVPPFQSPLGEALTPSATPGAVDNRQVALGSDNTMM